MTDQFDTPEKRAAWLKSFPQGSQPEQIFKDCRSLQDPFYRDLKGNHKYKVTEDLILEVTGGTLVASDEDGNVAFIVSEHDFSNFMECYVGDRIRQTFEETRTSGE